MIVKCRNSDQESNWDFINEKDTNISNLRCYQPDKPLELLTYKWARNIKTKYKFSNEECVKVKTERLKQTMIN